MRTRWQILRNAKREDDGTTVLEWWWLRRLLRGRFSVMYLSISIEAERAAGDGCGGRGWRAQALVDRCTYITGLGECRLDWPDKRIDEGARSDPWNSVFNYAAAGSPSMKRWFVREAGCCVDPVRGCRRTCRGATIRRLVGYLGVTSSGNEVSRGL